MNRQSLCYFKTNRWRSNNQTIQFDWLIQEQMLLKPVGTNRKGKRAALINQRLFQQLNTSPCLMAHEIQVIIGYMSLCW